MKYIVAGATVALLVPAGAAGAAVQQGEPPRPDTVLWIIPELREPPRPLLSAPPVAVPFVRVGRARIPVTRFGTGLATLNPGPLLPWIRGDGSLDYALADPAPARPVPVLDWQRDRSLRFGALG
ncbi:MAG: hypothetical protein F4187_02535, partial [Gemmatimonadetes bacterium]|nr:hypothetical protein [Gemmatimonadota bacterium]MYI06353.1 hypothetical protein [Gemmatimonadota bacterium]